MAGIGALSVIALVVLLLRRPELVGVLFAIFAAGLLFFALRGLGSRVEVDDHALTLLRPLSPPQRVEFRQLAEVSEEGRLHRVIVLLYYPLHSDGLVDLDDLRSLALPALEDQYALLELLDSKVPR
jgi:predicted secreted protein